MDFEQQARTMSTAEVATLLGAHQTLQTRVDQLSQQLEWFQRQLFGNKSERRLVDIHPAQLSLGEDLSAAPSEDVPVKRISAHTRRQRRRQRDDAAPAGLTFDPRVPVERIEIEDPALAGVDPERLERVGEKLTRRLAQRPGSYVILEFVRTVYKRRDTGELSCPPAPVGVLERSHADVSILAGLVIDKSYADFWCMGVRAAYPVG